MEKSFRSIKFPWSSSSDTSHTSDRDSSHEAKPRLVVTIAIVCLTTCASAMNGFLSGIMTINLNALDQDLGIGSSLQLWPVSVFALACGCTLLLSGSICDNFGPKITYVLGCFQQAIFCLACGLCRTPIQIIIFRALSGIAMAFCLPASISLISQNLYVPQAKSIALSCMGSGLPLGFSIGLFVGGVVSDELSWRWGFHIAAISNTMLGAAGGLLLPGAFLTGHFPDLVSAFIRGVDWLGTFLLSTALALLFTLMAILGKKAENIRNPGYATLLAVSVTLFAILAAWTSRQIRLARPTAIPSVLWADRSVICVSLSALLIWGSYNAIENIMSLIFQRIQLLNGIQSALRFLPVPIMGIIGNTTTGLLVVQVKPRYIVGVGITLSLVSSLVMVIGGNSNSSYWSSGFMVLIFNSMGADALYTIANMLITQRLPETMQGLAGGIFNTVAQLGKGLGLTLSNIITASVAADMARGQQPSNDDVFQGYVTTFWYTFSASLAAMLISVYGLWHIRTLVSP